MPAFAARPAAPPLTRPRVGYRCQFRRCRRSRQRRRGCRRLPPAPPPRPSPAHELVTGASSAGANHPAYGAAAAAIATEDGPCQIPPTSPEVTDPKAAAATTPHTGRPPPPSRPRTAPARYHRPAPRSPTRKPAGLIGVGGGRRGRWRLRGRGCHRRGRWGRRGCRRARGVDRCRRWPAGPVETPRSRVSSEGPVGQAGLPRGSASGFFERWSPVASGISGYLQVSVRLGSGDD